eukprot:Protomagalhaensia_sp_Gyna_25__5482@NODE_727_length_2751_cov_23_392699_g567_i0_p3_GENE_NODE_727_length_2751_cov_23_392699_g567_i0NODE_727_length_2751_cov_23_392699_g567_i0_p3_ORF_typecomplete_len134_score13_15_NODE_727_length_2751_cov_23_392699_g567_i08891290
MDVSGTMVESASTSTMPVQPPLTIEGETTGEGIWIPSQDTLITTSGGTVYSLWSEAPSIDPGPTMSGQTYSDFTTSTAFIQLGLSTESEEVGYEHYPPRPFEWPYADLAHPEYAKFFDQGAIVEIPLGAYPPL